MLLYYKRKSSCVNARGILTAAYQVLHLLPEVGHLARSDWGGGYPRQGTTPSRGTPSQVWWWGTPCQGYSPSRVPPSRVSPSPGQVWQGGTWGGVTPSRVPLPHLDLDLDRQMDRHMSKHNLPVVLRTRSVNIIRVTRITQQIQIQENERSTYCVVNKGTLLNNQINCSCYWQQQSWAVRNLFTFAIWSVPGRSLTTSLVSMRPC